MVRFGCCTSTKSAFRSTDCFCLISFKNPNHRHLIISRPHNNILPFMPYSVCLLFENIADSTNSKSEKENKTKNVFTALGYFVSSGVCSMTQLLVCDNWQATWFILDWSLQTFHANYVYNTNLCFFVSCLQWYVYLHLDLELKSQFGRYTHGKECTREVYVKQATLIRLKRPVRLKNTSHVWVNISSRTLVTRESDCLVSFVNSCKYQYFTVRVIATIHSFHCSLIKINVDSECSDISLAQAE